jgi:hypothetical protein
MRKIRVYPQLIMSYGRIMTNEIKSFRDILRAEFQNRLRRDPHYRLLDFAKDLATPISRMSEIMSGRSGISTQRALHYSEALKLSTTEKSSFLQLVSNECSRTKWTRTTSAPAATEAKSLISTSFAVPAHKKDEFVQFLKISLNQWFETNPTDSSPETKIILEASEQIYASN